MAKAKNKLQYKVVVDSSMQFTDDDICRLFFGKNKEQLVKDIRENKGGKYDNLYDEGE